MFLFLLGCIVSGEPSGQNTSSVQWHEVGFNKARYAVDTSVKISIWSEGSEIGHGSGNHFSFYGSAFVLTAAHVIDSENEIYILDKDKKVGAKVAFVDFEADIAILVPDDILKTKAAKWRRSKSAKILGKDTMYAGYP